MYQSLCNCRVNKNWSISVSVWEENHRVPGGPCWLEESLQSLYPVSPLSSEGCWQIATCIMMYVRSSSVYSSRRQAFWRLFGQTSCNYYWPNDKVTFGTKERVELRTRVEAEKPVRRVLPRWKSMVAVDLEKGEQIWKGFDQVLLAKAEVTWCYDGGQSSLSCSAPLTALTPALPAVLLLLWIFRVRIFCSFLFSFSNPLNIDVPRDFVLGSVLFHSHSLPEWSHSLS